MEQQQVSAPSAKTEDRLANASLEESIYPGKILNNHSTKHNVLNCIYCILGFEHSFPFPKIAKLQFLLHLGTDIPVYEYKHRG